LIPFTCCGTASQLLSRLKTLRGWAIRQQRQALIDAGALALHMGRTFVHRERLVKVMRDQALEAYKQRHPAAAR
jgi:hypothetical protein